ncbi:hypothetical protein OC834_003958 [Tilletia horrida]|nr:hypothetical protein OC834_003958 [Tilletia horrida]
MATTAAAARIVRISSSSSRSSRSSSSHARLRRCCAVRLASTSTSTSSSTSGSSTDELTAKLSSADALAAARSMATLSAHWDERGVLDGFAAYQLISRFGLTGFLGAGYEALVAHEQSAAVYVPTWIVDAALSFDAVAAGREQDREGAEHESARTTLLLEHARFPGSTWAPVSSLPIWPAFDLAGGEQDSSAAPGQDALSTLVSSASASASSLPFAGSSAAEYQQWNPEAHLSTGTLDADKAVEIDGPISALPFELSPLALPSFLRSQAAQKDGEEELLTLSTRQPSTAAEVVLLLRKDRQELASVTEAESIDGIEFSANVSASWFTKLSSFLGYLLNPNSSLLDLRLSPRDPRSSAVP